jgi:hypothetical protein
MSDYGAFGAMERNGWSDPARANFGDETDIEEDPEDGGGWRRCRRQDAAADRAVRPRLFDSLGYRGLGKLSVILKDYAQPTFGQGQKSWPRRAFGW